MHSFDSVSFVDVTVLLLSLFSCVVHLKCFLLSNPCLLQSTCLLLVKSREFHVSGLALAEYNGLCK
jgi:hypothetical protein